MCLQIFAVFKCLKFAFHADLVALQGALFSSARSSYRRTVLLPIGRKNLGTPRAYPYQSTVRFFIGYCIRLSSQSWSSREQIERRWHCLPCSPSICIFIKKLNFLCTLRVSRGSYLEPLTWWAWTEKPFCTLPHYCHPTLCALFSEKPFSHSQWSLPR